MKIWSDAKTKRDKKRLYLSLIPVVRKVARDSGYAIGVHGSLTRDLDLIAVPWIKKAVKAETLALRVHQATCKYPYTRSGLKKKVTQKPHGRVGYDLILGHGGAYIDLSITSLTPALGEILAS